jgi:hypothetical protein
MITSWIPSALMRSLANGAVMKASYSGPVTVSDVMDLS